MKQLFTYLFLSLFAIISFACTPPKTDNFGGLALYTLRDTMASAPKEVLKQVEHIGYAYVEAAGYDEEARTYYGMAPTEFNAYLDEIGLIPMSTHQASITLDNADQHIEDAVAAGFKYLVIPIPPMGHFRYFQDTQSMGMSNEVEEVTNILNAIGEKAANAGIELLYHNHDFEFVENENGIVPIDYFLENTNPEHVNFQMDLYWATKAGADPVAYFEEYPGRFKAWHVKDMDEEGRFAPVGKGTIDFGHIYQHRELSGMKHYFVEQDQTYSMSPLQAVGISHEGLKEFGFH